MPVLAHFLKSYIPKESKQEVTKVAPLGKNDKKKHAYGPIQVNRNYLRIIKKKKTHSHMPSFAVEYSAS